jgi:hypothetical protein
MQIHMRLDVSAKIVLENVSPMTSQLLTIVPRNPANLSGGLASSLACCFVNPSLQYILKSYIFICASYSRSGVTRSVEIPDSLIIFEDGFGQRIVVGDAARNIDL